MRAVNIPNTSLRIRYSNNEFVVISFGLKNCLTEFMDMMIRLFRQYLDMIVTVFINNLLIYSMRMNMCTIRELCCKV